MTQEALKALIHEMEYVLSCINERKIPFDGDDFHEALRLGKKALAQPEHEKYCPICQGVGQVDTGIMESPVTICNACNGAGLKAQPEQEPVVWMYQDKSTHEVRFQKHMRDFVDHGATYETPLYTTPLQRTWVGLTDEEVRKICVNEWGGYEQCRAIEAKLKEKNT